VDFYFFGCSKEFFFMRKKKKFCPSPADCIILFDFILMMLAEGRKKINNVLV